MAKILQYSFRGAARVAICSQEKRANILLVQNLALVNSSPVGSRTLIDGTGSSCTIWDNSLWYMLF